MLWSIWVNKDRTEFVNIPGTSPDDKFTKDMDKLLEYQIENYYDAIKKASRYIGCSEEYLSTLARIQTKSID